MVGVNAFEVDDDELTEIHRPDPAAETRQSERLERTMAARDDGRRRAALADARARRAASGNLMPPLIESARARVCEGEMVGPCRASSAPTPRRRSTDPADSVRGQRVGFSSMPARRERLMNR